MMASLAVDVYVMTRHVVAFIHVSAVHPCVAHVPYTLLSGTCLYRVIMCYRTAVLGRTTSPDAWFKFVVFSILGQNSDSHTSVTYIYCDQSECQILRHHIGALVGVLTIDDVDQYLTLIFPKL